MEVLMSEEEKNRIVDIQRKYYKFVPALFEIAKVQYHRELAFISPKECPKRYSIRYMVAFNIRYLEKHLVRAGVFTYPLNMYQSVAVLRNIPVFSYNSQERTKDAKYKEFNENYEDEIFGYDLFLDLDGKEDFNKCYEEAKFIMKLLSSFKLPFYCLNSSANGFHFRIPYDYMPIIDLRVINEVIQNLITIYGLETLDELVVDSKRLCKTPYSVCKEVICLPMTDEQFNNFSIDMVKVENVLKMDLQNRGLLIRDWGLSKEELKNNVGKFLMQFSS